MTVMTNGTLLTPEIADLFVELRPRAIEITMYGATEETYERVTQTPGAFARFRRSLDLLRERSLPLMLKSVLLTLNRHELATMRALAREYRASFRYDGLLWPRLDGSRAPLTYQLPVEELLALTATTLSARRAGVAWPAWPAARRCAASTSTVVVLGCTPITSTASGACPSVRWRGGRRSTWPRWALMPPGSGWGLSESASVSSTRPAAPARWARSVPCAPAGRRRCTATTRRRSSSCAIWGGNGLLNSSAWRRD